MECEEEKFTAGCALEVNYVMESTTRRYPTKASKSKQSTANAIRSRLRSEKSQVKLCVSSSGDGEMVIDKLTPKRSYNTVRNTNGTDLGYKVAQRYYVKNQVVH